MRDRDLELIAALVEGRLEDETEARALIASSPEHQAEYEAQKLAFTTLQEAGPASMTETERAVLHRDVWSTFRTEVAAKPARSPWYYRWAPVTAVLFVAVGLTAVLSQGGDDGATETANLAADLPVETTGAADAATAEDGTAETFAEAGGLTTDTTEAATEGTTTPEEGEAGADERTDTDLAPVPDDEAAFYTAQAAEVRVEESDEESPSTSTTEAAAISPSQACVDTAASDAGLGDYRFVTMLPSPTGDGTEIAAAIAEGVDPTSAPVAFVQLNTCELVYLHE